MKNIVFVVKSYRKSAVCTENLTKIFPMCFSLFCMNLNLEHCNARMLSCFRAIRQFLRNILHTLKSILHTLNCFGKQYRRSYGRRLYGLVSVPSLAWGGFPVTKTHRVEVDCLTTV